MTIKGFHLFMAFQLLTTT